MSIAQTGQTTTPKPLRLWPGIAAVVLQGLVMFVVPVFVPEAKPLAVIGALLFGLVIIVWWAFFSRAPRLERWGGVLLMIAALGATSRVIHKSIATGMMGFMFFAYAIPVVSFALVVWAVAGRRLSEGPRRATMAATILLASGMFTLLRTNGITGEADSDFAWRWTKTSEERLLAQAADEPVTPAVFPTTPAVLPAATAALPATPVVLPKTPAPLPEAPAAAETGAYWPGFRGPHRDGSVSGVRIETDWSASPPVALWRRPIGPGWSSFAVRGNLLYTQEQRGEGEVVSCYSTTTGKPVWTHRDAARFWESNAGAGPRATPTLSNGRVYTFGATGIVNALDARNGAALWSRNAASDTSTKVPGWGFTSSPLVAGNVVIVAASGRLVAYDLATGEPRWLSQRHGGSYSSPQLFTIDGVPQVVLVTGTGAVSVAPADGAVLWENRWASGSAIVQPAQMPDGDLLFGNIDMAAGVGTRRLGFTHGASGWTVEERWTSPALKPYFNDFVIHDGHAYGFDGSILACIDLKDGKRVWKGGRYGHGQIVLLPDQNLLLVLSEEGELALVGAAPDQFKEIARFRAIEGKTWNHPVLTGDVLLVRNGEEMAAFRLSLAHP